MMLIYDGGKIYTYEIDPNNLPEWLIRAYELESNSTYIYNNM